MRQKFRKLSFVHVCKDMTEIMSHFDSDFDAIVDGTYSQLHGGKNINKYCLYKLRDGKIVDHIAWYCEEQLTLLDNQGRDSAEDMIEKYNFNVDDD